MSIKILGVDIGIASTGWALIEIDEHTKENGKLIDCGVRIFEKAENPKNGESLALPRRRARGIRKNTKRRKQRVEEVKKILLKYLDIFPEDMFQKDVYLPKLFNTSKDFLSPWQLRSEGLVRKLTDIEFARALLHIAKRRGYNDLGNDLDSKEDEEESKITLEAIANNRKKLKEGRFKSVGEMMFKTYFNKEISKGMYENVRNRTSKEDKEKLENPKTPAEEKRKIKKKVYKRSISRQELKDEIRVLFEAQKKLGNKKATQDLEEKISEAIFYQRDLKSFESLVGKCKFYPEKNRAAKSCCSVEKFLSLTKIINTIKNIERHNTNKNFDQKIKEFIQETLDEAKKVKSGVSYKKFRKILGLEEEATFRFNEKYDKNLDYTKKDTEKAIFIKFEKYHKLKDYLADFSSEFNTMSDKTLDKISNIIAFNKSPKDIKNRLKNLDISQEMKNVLLHNKLGFNGTVELSLSAIYQILPFMESGKKYDEAIELAGLIENEKSDKEDFLPPLCDTSFDTLNPVVNRAISQYRKIVNAVIKKHGKIHKVHIELTREVGKSLYDRNNIAKEQKENYDRNKIAIEKCREIGLEENGKNILMIKLWLRQDEYCIYSGEKIQIEKNLKAPNALEIDHIYPLSRSLDNSQNNKVLVFTEQNQNKSNKTPYEWLGNDEKKWGELMKLVHTMKKLPKNVKRRITNPKFVDKKIGSRGDFLARNLNDTGYINRFVSQYTNAYLSFLPLEKSEDTSLKAGSKGSKRHVQIISGSLTSMLRHYWGLDSKDRNTHLHHAQDAIIIAFTTASNIKAFSDYLKAKENGYYKKFKAEDKAKNLEEGQDTKTKYFLREPIKDFRDKVQEAIDNIFVSKAPRRTVTGELHEQTVQRQEKYFDAYGGEEGVKKAIMLGKIRSHNGGIVDNGNMVRTDIFRSKINKKYYAVPIYTYDVAIGKLPNKAIVSGKDKAGVIKDWLEMDEKYEFCFSLFKNDLVEIQNKKIQKSVYAYYAGVSSSTAYMILKHHSGNLKEVDKGIFDKNSILGTGIQDLEVFKKHIVSPLGEIIEARFEPRKNIALKTTKK